MSDWKPGPNLQADIDRLEEDRADQAEGRRVCWPEWKGPAVSDDLSGRIEVDTVGRYLWAPARILAIEGNELTVEIDYGPDEPEHCRAENGTRLTIDLADVWPPTKLLWGLRHADAVKEAREQGLRCACGADPDHPYGGHFECDTCRKARLLSTPT